jgi:hypothetical protein
MKDRHSCNLIQITRPYNSFQSYARLSLNSEANMGKISPELKRSNAALLQRNDVLNMCAHLASTEVTRFSCSNWKNAYVQDRPCTLYPPQTSHAACQKKRQRAPFQAQKGVQQGRQRTVVSSKQTMHAFLGLEVNKGSNKNNDKRALFWLRLSGECSTK